MFNNTERKIYQKILNISAYITSNSTWQYLYDLTNLNIDLGYMLSINLTGWYEHPSSYWGSMTDAGFVRAAVSGLHVGDRNKLVGILDNAGGSVRIDYAIIRYLKVGE